MRKYLVTLLVILGVSVSGVATASLYDWYASQGLKLPPVEARRPLAESCGISNYIGLKSQNLALEQCLNKEGVLGAIPLPTDNYDTNLTLPLSASASTVYVNAIPTGITESIYTVFATDGVTPREKLYCTGTASSPNRLTGCVRGISFSPVTGVIDETAGTGLTHSKNARIAITDNINFSGKALNILYGNQPTGSSTFYIGANTSDSIKLFKDSTGKYIYAQGNTGNPFLKFNSSTNKWQWSEDGTNTYNFASSTISQLSASTTAGIGITDSKIHVNASSTTGMSFDSSGALYQKTQTATGIESDTNGLKINTSTLTSLIATSTPTASQIPLATASGTIDNAWIKNRFGGDGTDGALNITSNTTTLDLNNAAIVVKNYTSINISAGAALAFSNATSAGTFIILKSQGDCTIAGTIQATSTGAIGGTAVSRTTNGVTAGNIGTNGRNGLVAYTNAGKPSTNEASVGSGGAVASFKLATTFDDNYHLLKYPNAFIGAGGASGHATCEGGCNGSTTSGAGGRGAGAIIIECNGNLVFSGTINLNGTDGGNADGDNSFYNERSGGGGGGAGGYCSIGYSGNLTGSGTINVAGGTGGNGAADATGSAGGGGGAGASAGSAGTVQINYLKNGGDGATGLYKIWKNTLWQ